MLVWNSRPRLFGFSPCSFESFGYPTLAFPITRLPNYSITKSTRAVRILSVLLLCPLVAGLWPFQLPDYQITQLPNPPGVPPSLIPIIPIWPTLQDFTPMLVLDPRLRASVVFGVRFCFGHSQLLPITKLLNYQIHITQLPNPHHYASSRTPKQLI